MDKNKWLEIALKTLSYLITLVLGAMGMSMVSSCSSQREFVSRGSGTVLINDTIHLDHGSAWKYSRNGFKFK